MIIKFIKKNWFLILSLIYVVSPIDIIPEIFFGPLGLVDDAGVLILALMKATYDFVMDQKKQGKVKNAEIIEGEIVE